MPSRYGCARCGHPLALHSNGKTACRAVGCSVAPGQPCPGFVYELPVAAPEIQEAQAQCQ